MLWLWNRSTLQWDDDSQSENSPKWRSLMRIDWNKAQSSAGLVFIHLGLVGASLCWLVLGLAITVVDPFNCHNAERFGMHIKKDYIFLHNPRQIKLPVLDAHRIQITRLNQTFRLEKWKNSDCCAGLQAGEFGRFRWTPSLAKRDQILQSLSVALFLSVAWAYQHAYMHSQVHACTCWGLACWAVDASHSQFTHVHVHSKWGEINSVGNIVTQQADVTMGMVTCLHTILWPKTGLRSKSQSTYFPKISLWNMSLGGVWLCIHNLRSNSEIRTPIG